MAFKLSKVTPFKMEYNYWNIDFFTVSYGKGIKVVDVIFAGYLDEEARRNDGDPYERKTQQIPIEVFLRKVKEMVLCGIEFTDENIKGALYSLKKEYEMFKDAEDC